MIAWVKDRLASTNGGEHSLTDNYLTLGAAAAETTLEAATPVTPPSPRTAQRYVTAYNYEDNSPAYSDYVARGRHKGGGGAPPNDARADLGRNDFANPSSLAVGPEAVLEYGSRVFVDGFGWFLVEDHTAAGLSNAPRFDLWAAGATQKELNGLTGMRDVTVFAPGTPIPQEWRAQTATAMWDWQTWSSKQRIAQLKKSAGSKWHGLYVEGQFMA